MWPLHFQLGRTCMDLRIQSQSKFKRDLSYAVLLLCLVKMKNRCSGEAGAPLAFAVWVDFSSESPTFNFTDALGVRGHTLTLISVAHIAGWQLVV
ncbi:hypothetical protein AALO_G00147120 [Alosa alosa]|uniref:Uncharacterized protein n=1 Tax=Alosa alosa TaxID=278164 RepID=A0AAV6GJT3_9TELE|nr:hypothetical protein AALO_G00147120 [Alosa alosa]